MTEQTLYGSTNRNYLEKDKLIETESKSYQRQEVRQGGWGVSA